MVSSVSALVGQLWSPGARTYLKRMLPYNLRISQNKRPSHSFLLLSSLDVDSSHSLVMVSKWLEYQTDRDVNVYAE